MPSCLYREETEFEILSCFFLSNLDSTSATKKVRQAQQLKEAKTTKQVSAEPRETATDILLKKEVHEKFRIDVLFQNYSPFNIYFNCIHAHVSSGYWI